MIFFRRFESYVWDLRVEILWFGICEMIEFDLEDGFLGSEVIGGFFDKYEVKEKLGV